MFGAIKDWSLFGKAKASTSKELNSFLVIQRETTNLEDRNEFEMNGYGHLLLCPLCQEIYTHPVLLPCQHSLCYGCARAQILSSDNINHIRPIETGSKCASDTRNVSPAPTLASTRIRTVSSRYGESPTLQCYNETFSQNSICDTDESDVSMLIAPTECLQIECSKSNSAKSPISKAISPLFKKTPSKSNLLSPPKHSMTHPLRRSNSTSSVSRPMSAKCRPQQIYGTLRRSKVKSLFCPNCQEMVELGKLGISGLFRNFALESIVERFRVKAKAAVAIRCGYCKPPSSDATRSCLDCKLSYCNECYKIVHIWGTKKARHNFIGPTNNFIRPKVLLCPEHSSEVNMYCNRCKKSVCRMCKMGGGAHVNHSITSAKTAYKEGKERLCHELEKLQKKKEEVDAKIHAFGEVFTELERRDAQTREKIHSSLDGMYRVLEAKRSELLTKAELNFRDNEQYLRQELQCHHQRLMATSIANFAEEVLKETDPIYFLQTSRMLELRVKEVLESLDEVGSVEISIPYNDLEIDVSLAKSELQRIDFFTSPNKHEDFDYQTKKIEREKFTWILLQRDGFVKMSEDQATAHVSSLHFEPCVLRGSCAYSSGEYMWQVTVTSIDAKRILLGVSNLNSDEKLHGSISHDRVGAFLMIRPGSVSLFDGQWPFASPTDTWETKTPAHAMSIGEHRFAVRVNLRIDGDEATVHFYDVRSDSSVRHLMEKFFKPSGPVHPIVIVNGRAIVKLD